MDPFQREPVIVVCNHLEKVDKGSHGFRWEKCTETVEIKGLQSEWPKCAKGHTIKCPDKYFCWQPAKCINAGRCQGLRACND